MANISGIAIAEITAGLIIGWSGIENESVGDTIRTLIGGKLPAAQSSDTSVSGSSPGGGGSIPSPVASTGTARANQATARLLAAPYGWSTGQQWAALVALWNQESGWSNTIANPSSGAFGIAQALGHGTATSAGKYGNEYPSKAANDGIASAQISWGLSYIKQVYGSAEGAWSHEQEFNWY
jgi:hypothetical protein